MKYADVTEQLRRAYATSAQERDGRPKHHWKVDERRTFLERLRAEGKTRLLEIGAGTGQDSVYFAETGLDVVATDLTPEMVAFCREKGLDARVMDALNLDLPDASFDAVWSINCLLHVPNADMPDALAEIARVMHPEGLFFLGVYGGDGRTEGVDANDWHDPPRFFSFRSDDEIRDFVSVSFDTVDFHVISGDRLHFQSFTLRKPA